MNPTLDHILCYGGVTLLLCSYYIFTLYTSKYDAKDFIIAGIILHLRSSLSRPTVRCKITYRQVARRDLLLLYMLSFSVLFLRIRCSLAFYSCYCYPQVRHNAEWGNVVERL